MMLRKNEENIIGHLAWKSRWQLWSQTPPLSLLVHTSSTQLPPRHTINVKPHTQRHSPICWSDTCYSWKESEQQLVYNSSTLYCKALQKVHTHLSSIQSQSKRGVDEPWNLRAGGQSIILMNFPMERVSKSPQETQNEQLQSQSSSWWARMILCNVTSQRVKVSCSIQTQNLKQNEKGMCVNDFIQILAS